MSATRLCGADLESCGLSCPRTWRRVRGGSGIGVMEQKTTSFVLS